MVTVKFKRLHPSARIPTKSTDDAGCYDLYCPADERRRLYSGESQIIPVYLCVEIPKGYRGILTARSSQSLNSILVLPGVIDSDYRGDIGPRLLNLGKNLYDVSPDERIAQFHIERVDEIFWLEVPELSNTLRGARGFGSTGK